MALVEWIGNALPVAQVTTVTPTAANNTVYTLTINGKDVSYTSDASGTVAEIVTGLYNRWVAVALLAGEFAEVTPTDNATLLTLTARTAGIPFTVTSTGAGTLAVSTTTAATGPNFADNVDNWSGGAVPSSSDTITFARPVSVKYALTALAAVATSTVKILPSFWAGGASIGLPKTNGSGAFSYNEYRNRSLQFDGATLVEIGQGDGSGSSIINLDFLTGNVASLTVFNTPTSLDTTRPALCLVLNPAAAADGVVEFLRGSIGVGFYGETCKCLPRIGYVNNQVGDAQVVFGTAVTFGATFVMAGGRVEVNTATTAITQDKGELTINGTGAHPVIVNNGGTVFYNSTGTFGATTNTFAGTLDFTRDMTAKTQGAQPITLYRGATLRDPHGVVASLAYKPVGCVEKDLTLELQPNKIRTLS